jgi:hypothetical protein
VADAKVAAITWRQISPNELELSYTDGTVERVEGTHAHGAHMADGAGMQAMPSPLGIVRWAVPAGADGRTRPRGATATKRPGEGRAQPRRDGRAPKRIGPWLSG